MLFLLQKCDNNIACAWFFLLFSYSSTSKAIPIWYSILTETERMVICTFVKELYLKWASSLSRHKPVVSQINSLLCNIHFTIWNSLTGGISNTAILWKQLDNFQTQGPDPKSSWFLNEFIVTTHKELVLKHHSSQLVTLSLTV